MSVTDAKYKLKELVDEARKGSPTILTRHERDVAMIMAVPETPRAPDPPADDGP